MATKLTKPLSREIQIEDKFGKIGGVVITITSHGIEFRRKGSQKRKLFVEWKGMEKVLGMNPEMPAKYSSNMFGWLIEE